MLHHQLVQEPPALREEDYPPLHRPRHPPPAPTLSRGEAAGSGRDAPGDDMLNEPYQYVI